MNTAIILTLHAALLAVNTPDLDRFACLQAAYPDHVQGIELDASGTSWVQTAGGRFVWDDGRAKTFAQRLAAPDLQDTMAIRYATGDVVVPPGKDQDPGRFRVDGFLKSLYGGTARAVSGHLERVAWMPKHGGKTLSFNGQHGAAGALRRVSADLDALPERFHRYVKVTAGTFNWRTISGTDRLSAHSYAIAIDINVEHTDYWRWRVKREPDLPWRNRIPMEVVDVFERHGFVWGGKWFHYDTMHFEYRPELLQPGCLAPAPAHHHDHPKEAHR